MRKLAVLAAIVVSMLVIAGCSDQSATEKESENRNQNYTQLQNQQPAGAMDYSPTRETINFWMDTWGENGKVSYVYLIASTGNEVGYYVLEGLPVSYCASLSPTEKLEWEGGNLHQMPAEAMDGVYYSGQGCDTYYGKDAVSGSYVEWSIGNGISHLVTEAPLPRPEAEPITTTSVEDVENGEE